MLWATVEDVPEGSSVSVTATLEPPTAASAAIRPVTLYDDGLHNDGAAGDGYFGNTFYQATVAGRWTSRFAISGTLPNGTEFERAGNVQVSIDAKADSDADGLADVWEMRETGSLTVLTSSTADNDSDSFTNADEFALGLSPLSADSDGDGTTDTAILDLDGDPRSAAYLVTQISGRVFEDFDQDGDADNGEPGFTGRSVFLDLNENGLLDPSEPRTRTIAGSSDTQGTFSFSQLTEREYRVLVEPLAGEVRTSPPSVVELTQTQVLNKGAELPSSFGGGRSIAILPTSDGHGDSVYVSSTNDDAIYWFDTFTSPNVLTYRQRYTDSQLDFPSSVVVTSAGIVETSQNLERVLMWDYRDHKIGAVDAGQLRLIEQRIYRDTTSTTNSNDRRPELLTPHYIVRAPYVPGEVAFPAVYIVSRTTGAISVYTDGGGQSFFRDIYSRQ